jgi:hypothetical protein
VRTIQDHHKRSARYYLESTGIGGLGEASAEIINKYARRRLSGSSHHAQGCCGSGTIGGLMPADKARGGSNWAE